MNKIKNSIITTIVLSIAVIFFTLAMSYFKILNMQEEINYNKVLIKNITEWQGAIEKNGINIR